jgi:hypothetical protein
MQIRAAVIFFVAGIPAPAQSHAFVYLAPGGALTRAFAGDVFLHFGGGGEYVLRNGIGLGADAGAIGLLFGGTTGTLSLNGSYHFRHQRLVDPFVIAGYSLFFDRTAMNFFLPGPEVHQENLSLFNFGGGMNLWFSRHVGAKIELRDHVHSGSGSTLNYVEFMLGLGFH